MDLSSYSLEATRPTADELARLRDIAPAGMALYLSRVPAETMREQADTVAAVQRAGYEPVAHIAARRVTSEQELRDFLARVCGEAGMRRALVIAGDSAQLGPYADALAVIQSGHLQDAGLNEIGIAGYPEPHPSIPAEALHAAMQDKIAAAVEAGLRLHIVTQFSFDGSAIVGWLQALRARGVTAPVKVGMAGPTKLTSLLRYAARCGVKASVQGLASGAAAALAGQVGRQNVGPDRIVEALAAAEGLGDAAPHYFSFGGLNDTARYAETVARTAHQRAIKRPNEDHEAKVRQD